jgi:hypothetical protein
LPSIANSGLLPFESSTGPGVFFVDNEKAAARFGVVLRFPWPARSKARGDYFIASEVVPTDGMEVLIRGRWVPISEFYDPDV